MILVHCSNCNKDIPLMEIDSNFHDQGLCCLTSEDKFNDKIGVLSLIFGLWSVIFIVIITQSLFKNYGEIALLYGILSGLPFMILSCILQLGLFDSIFSKIQKRNDVKDTQQSLDDVSGKNEGL